MKYININLKLIYICIFILTVLFQKIVIMLYIFFHYFHRIKKN